MRTTAAGQEDEGAKRKRRQQQKKIDEAQAGGPTIDDLRQRLVGSRCGGRHQEGEEGHADQRDHLEHGQKGGAERAGMVDEQALRDCGRGGREGALAGRCEDNEEREVREEREGCRDARRRRAAAENLAFFGRCRWLCCRGRPARCGGKTEAVRAEAPGQEARRGAEGPVRVRVRERGQGGGREEGPRARGGGRERRGGPRPRGAAQRGRRRAAGARPREAGAEEHGRGVFEMGRQ